MLHISLAALPQCCPPTLPTIPPATNQGPVTPLGRQSPFTQHLTICHRARSASVTGTRHNPCRQSVHNQAHSGYDRDRSFKPASQSPAPAYLLPISNASPQSMPPSLLDGSLSMLHISHAALLNAAHQPCRPSSMLPPHLANHPPGKQPRTCHAPRQAIAFHSAPYHLSPYQVGFRDRDPAQSFPAIGSQSST